MARVLLVVCLLAGAILIGGCGKADITVPPVPSVPYGEPPPPSYVAPADPNSVSDLRRENDQLRARLAYLEDQNVKYQRAYAKEDKQAADLRAEMQKLAAERDRYKSAVGK